jgi:hypothetical protein
MRLAWLQRPSTAAPCRQRCLLLPRRSLASVQQVPIHEQIEATAAASTAANGASGDRRVGPRRSALYMPGSRRRALEKARTLPADCIIMDCARTTAGCRCRCCLGCCALRGLR